MASANPVKTLIDQALDYMRKKDPTWDHFQPTLFRARVVEVWKRTLKTEMYYTAGVMWTLNVGPCEFTYLAGLFTVADIHYNPYLAGRNKSW